MVKNGWLQIRIDEGQLKVIDVLVECTGKTRSEVLRDLIPDSSLVDALKEVQAASNRTARDTAKILKNVFLQTARDRLRREHKGRENPFALQMAIVDKAVGQKPDSIDLFTARLKAERGVKDFEIKRVRIKDSKGQPREEFVITGPGVFGTDESLCRLSWEMEKFLQEFTI